MSLSLSILVPVRNRQGDLDRLLRQAVEVLPDLARFNLLIVDDASTDATYEVAHDWSRRYPQVRVLRQSEQTGVYTSIRTGLRHLTGDIVMLVRLDRSFDSSVIARMWWQMPGHEIVVAKQPAASATRSWLAGQPSMPVETGVQLFRRPLLQLWATSGVNEEPLTYLVLQGYVPLLLDAPAMPRTVMLPRGKRLDSQPAAAEPKRPNYLAKLRELAWGE